MSTSTTILKYKGYIFILTTLVIVVLYELYQSSVKNIYQDYDTSKNLDRNINKLKGGNSILNQFHSQRSFQEIIPHSYFDNYKRHKEVLHKNVHRQDFSKKLEVNTEKPKVVSATTVTSAFNDETYPPNYEAKWVNSPGTFEERLGTYNQEISKIRDDILRSRRSLNWTYVHRDIRVFWCNHDDFLKEMAKYPQVTTIALTWRNDSSTMEGSGNCPLPVVHPWTGSHLLCVLISTTAYTKAKWDAVYNKECTSDLNMTSAVMPLEPLYFHGRPINRQHYWPHNGLAYPHYFYHTYPRQVLYMHILQDGIITGLGDVISGSLKLLPYTCSQDTDPRPPRGYEETPIHNEVFVITQYWGESFFHKMIEDLPRISPYMSFLKAHPNIKIHVAEIKGYTEKSLNFLGFNSSRFVTGVCRSKIVYLPQATPCGFAQVQSTQYLSKLYRMIMDEKFSKQQRNSIVLIKRSSSRRFTEQRQIERMLESLAKEFGMIYELFPDNPSPSQEVTMLLFRRAVLIVAPHGAGLSNMIYSEPGSYVIEGVCNPPHVNMCFQWVAHILGHHYHGITSRRGCEDVVDVDASEIYTVAKYFLSHQ